MPQEYALYLALLADLSDSSLVELFGRELRRRGRMGMALAINMGPGGHMSGAGVYPDEWAELYTMPLGEQMAHLAAYASLGREIGRRLAEEDDGMVAPV